MSMWSLGGSTRLFAAVLVLLALTACRVNKGSSADAVEAGTREQQARAAMAADRFLKQLDSGDIDGTWEQASPHLHQITNRADWANAVRTMRKAMGAVRGRKVKGFGFTHAIDGIPPGDYVAVVLDTEFAAAKVEEKVVLHQDQGRWKPVGYFLSKRLTFGAASK